MFIFYRKYVHDEMLAQVPKSFDLHEPTATKKVHHTQLVALGPNHEWSGDGHDKLSAIRFPIWGIHDKWSGRWLGLWVVPNNRVKNAVAYMYLSLVYRIGGKSQLDLFGSKFDNISQISDHITGMSVQMTTDCGSETTEVFGFANALR